MRRVSILHPLALVLVSVPLSSAAGLPVITKATPVIDPNTNTSIVVVSGRSFGYTPEVFLGTEGGGSLDRPMVSSATMATCSMATVVNPIARLLRCATRMIRSPSAEPAHVVFSASVDHQFATVRRMLA